MNIRLRIPLILSIRFALCYFFPHSDRMLGWGEDVFFNLWTLEHIWLKLNQLGILNVFSADFWSTPIFFPTPNT